MNTPKMDPELAELVARATDGLLELPFPPARPAPGQSRAAWTGVVARLRHRHDAQALERTRALGADAAPREGVGEISYVDVPIDGDEVGVRLYQPLRDGPDAVEPGPAVVLFHGGAWWMGGGATGFELNDVLCRQLVAGLGAVVANVDYRLAPEHPYPAQLEDGYRALDWLHEHSARLGVDPERIAVCGMSSGGNLAAALSMLARDRVGPAIAAQVLLAPSLDFTASLRVTENEPVMLATIKRLRSFYANEVEDWTLPYLSPAIAADLTDLPPALIITGDHDPLQPDGETYHQRLVEAGVASVHLAYEMTHVLATPAVRATMRDDLINHAARLLRVEPRRTAG